MADETEHTGAPAPPDAACDADLTPAPDKPPLPPTAAALAGTAKDLKALRDALVDAASVGAGLCSATSLFCSTFASPLAA